MVDCTFDGDSNRTKIEGFGCSGSGSMSLSRTLNPIRAFSVKERKSRSMTTKCHEYPSSHSNQSQVYEGPKFALSFKFGRPLLLLLSWVFVIGFCSRIVVAEGMGHLPSFIQNKLMTAAQSQPGLLGSIVSDGVPDFSHYIHAKLQSRNDRHFDRSDNVFEAHIILNAEGVKAQMVNKKKNIEYLYNNGRLLLDWDCVTDPETVAPLAQFKDFVQQLEEVLKGEGLNSETFDNELNSACSGMKKFGIVYAETPMVLCADDMELRHIVSEMMWVDILEWSVDKTRVDLMEQQLPIKDESFFRCLAPMMSEKTEVLKPFGSVASPWFKDSRICKLPFLRDRSFCSDNDPIPATKDCVFLHGVGETEIAESTPIHPDYWGHVEDYTPQCKTRVFIRQETKSRGWTDEDLQRAYCKAALQGSSDNVIRNKVLFIHSMGNLILGGAIKNGICQIDEKTTSWYNIMGPLRGSDAANMLDVICDTEKTGRGNAIFRYIAQKGGYCEPGKGKPYLAYETLRTGYKGLADAMEIVNRYATGSMCGDSPLGIISPYSVLKLLSMVVGYDSENDGMVTIKSCQLEGKKDYEGDSASKWYLATINHADGTCRSGNSWIFGKGKAPCSYYTGKL